jgi:hypothetical protein
MHEALIAEWRRITTPPFETLSVLLGNALLVVLGWAFLPVDLLDLVLSYSGPHALPLSLLVWMVADVPATNVVGSDLDRVVAALDDPRRLRLLFEARGLVLWALTAPPCAIVDMVVGVDHHDQFTSVVMTAVILVVPLATLGCSSIVGVLLPYRVIPLRRRLADLRNRPRRTLRWLLAALAPYVVVPALGDAIILPIQHLGLG